MGKVENALREEIQRLARKEVRALLEKTVDDVRKLKARVRALEAELQAMKTAKARQQARERIATAQREIASGEASRIRMSAGLIKKLRLRLKLSQPKFARILGVSNAAVGFWESGKANPRPEMRVKIAALRQAGRRDVMRLLAEKEAKAAR